MKKQNLISRLDKHLKRDQFDIIEGSLLRRIKGGNIDPGCSKCKPNDGCNRNTSSSIV